MFEVERSSVDFEELRARLVVDQRRAWVRAVLRTVRGEPVQLLYALAIVGPRPANWAEQSWTYEECAFVSASMSVRKLACILKSGPQLWTIAAFEVFFEFLSESFMSERRPSFARYDELVLRWPSLNYSSNLVNVANVGQPPGYLVGDDAPTFPMFASAFQAFMYHNFAVTGVSTPRLGEVSIRVVDQRGCIRRPRFHRTAMDLYLGGRSLAGTTLELNSETYRMTVEATKPGRVRIPLPDGVPNDAWIWLKREREWLDFRSPSSWGGYTSPDVDVDQPKDPSAELGALLVQGEGTHLEYKSKLPDAREEKRKTFKSVAAFAMGEGGTLIFGIEDETGIVLGLSDRISGVAARFTDLARELVRPTPQFSCKAHRLDGKTLLVVEVRPSPGDIYGLVLDGNKPEYYVRRGATTFHAQPDELLRGVAQRAAV
jgi:hypothetical protein